MQNPTDGRTETDDRSYRTTYPYGTVLHAAGVVLSAAALGLLGIESPSAGLPVAVGALVALGILSSPPTSAPPAILEVVRGGALDGGMKQGVLIKSMFSVALLYAGTYPVVFDAGALAMPRLLLGVALGVSAIGTALEARWIGRVAATKSESSVRNGLDASQ